MTKLKIALAAVALLSGPAMAQTINNAPQNSPAGVQDQVKQAPDVGDPSQVGGTPSANRKGMQGQMQDPASPARSGTMAAPPAGTMAAPPTQPR
jgi:hypothetical protein